MIFKSKRYAFGLISFLAMMVSAWACHWLPGISKEVLVIAAGLVTAVITGDTVRPSKGE